MEKYYIVGREGHVYGWSYTIEAARKRRDAISRKGVHPFYEPRIIYSYNGIAPTLIVNGHSGRGGWLDAEFVD
jgi:hypothetical protein